MSDLEEVFIEFCKAKEEGREPDYMVKIPKSLSDKIKSAMTELDRRGRENAELKERIDIIKKLIIDEHFVDDQGESVVLTDSVFSWVDMPIEELREK